MISVEGVDFGEISAKDIQIDRKRMIVTIKGKEYPFIETEEPNYSSKSPTAPSEAFKYAVHPPINRAERRRQERINRRRK